LIIPYRPSTVITDAGTRSGRHRAVMELRRLSLQAERG
jgi:hypothetical protein